MADSRTRMIAIWNGLNDPRTLPNISLDQIDQHVNKQYYQDLLLPDTYVIDGEEFKTEKAEKIEIVDPFTDEDVELYEAGVLDLVEPRAICLTKKQFTYLESRKSAFNTLSISRGAMIKETDTGSIYVYNGSKWV